MSKIKIPIIFKKPKLIENENLPIIESEDKLEELLEKASSTTMVGKMIGDLYLAYRKNHLKDWTDLKTADEQIPYEHSPKTQKQLGYRLWWLSRPKTESNVRRRVYHGCWLDKKVEVIGGREHIKSVKLTKQAIDCFESRKEIFEALYL